MSREFIDRRRQSIPLTVGDPVERLNELAAGGEFEYLLAHADDGVIWGKVTGRKLALSGDSFPDLSPALRAETLQQARLFGSGAEAFLWRADDGWQGRTVTEAEGEVGPAYDEVTILWGTTVEARSGEFTRVVEGQQGIRHAPPVSLGPGKFESHSIRLVVRHYLDFDGDGAAFVSLSRLVDLTIGG